MSPREAELLEPGLPQALEAFARGRGHPLGPPELTRDGLDLDAVDARQGVESSDDLRTHLEYVEAHRIRKEQSYSHLAAVVLDVVHETHLDDVEVRAVEDAAGVVHGAEGVVDLAARCHHASLPTTGRSRTVAHGSPGELALRLLAHSSSAMLAFSSSTSRPCSR